MRRVTFGKKLPPVDDARVGDRFYDGKIEWIFDNGMWIQNPEPELSLPDATAADYGKLVGVGEDGSYTLDNDFQIIYDDSDVVYFKFHNTYLSESDLAYLLTPPTPDKTLHFDYCTVKDTSSYFPGATLPYHCNYDANDPEGMVYEAMIFDYSTNIKSSVLYTIDAAAELTFISSESYDAEGNVTQHTFLDPSVQVHQIHFLGNDYLPDHCSAGIEPTTGTIYYGSAINLHVPYIVTPGTTTFANVQAALARNLNVCYQEEITSSNRIYVPLMGTGYELGPNAGFLYKVIFYNPQSDYGDPQFLEMITSVENDKNAVLNWR